MMSLFWYYRPEHTQGGRNPSMHCEVSAGSIRATHHTAGLVGYPWERSVNNRLPSNSEAQEEIAQRRLP